MVVATHFGASSGMSRGLSGLPGCGPSKSGSKLGWGGVRIRSACGGARGAGQTSPLEPARLGRVRKGASRLVPAAVVSAASSSRCTLEFVIGVEESVVPDVKLTRSRDGSNGQATFVFENPTIFENDSEIVAKGEITGLYMTDEEGRIQTLDVVAKFLDGKPYKIEAVYTMKSQMQWDRFMRFMERYSNENGLALSKA
mmetsp:Transcript_15243/g.38777  ORF Transcript_15243/g.38777 Transcript_15243/m.38777 type:complete len:198 (+) Transcript_15243:235-828(+)